MHREEQMLFMFFNNIITTGQKPTFSVSSNYINENVLKKIFYTKCFERTTNLLKNRDIELIHHFPTFSLPDTVLFRVRDVLNSGQSLLMWPVSPQIKHRFSLSSFSSSFESFSSSFSFSFFFILKITVIISILYWKIVTSK